KPSGAMFALANAATFQCREPAGGAPKPKWCELLFTTGDLASWAFTVPEGYTGTTTVKVRYKMVSGTANYTEWTARFACMTPDDAADWDANAFDSDNVSADDEVPGTAGYLTAHSWTASNLDSMTDGDECVMQLERSTPTGSDATGDAEVLGVTIEW
ncbi:MAG TPA: hypothetical protein VFI02_16510, partial [Armatimonadota bacterium]|nr:hypothetical protein [Armatimonadota bacterium]